MARAAREISIDPNEVQIVHVFNRCVRRAFLYGEDPLTGKSYEHRRQWAREGRIRGHARNPGTG